MFSTTKSLPCLEPSGLALPTLVRRGPVLFLLAALLMASLAACGDDSGGAAGQTANEERPANTPTVSAPDGDTSTPEAQTQQSEPSAPAEATPTAEAGTQQSEPSAPTEATPTPEDQTRQSEPSAPAEATPTPEAETQESEPSAPAEATPTPEDQTPQGPELTTQEYAEAMETAFLDQEDSVESAGEDFFVAMGALFTSDELERSNSLAAAESWSEEDAAFASEFAETFLRALTGFYDEVVGALQNALDEMSDLRPPGHLSDLHNDFIAPLGEAVRLTQQQVDTAKDANTDIRNQEDLASFQAAINSLESGPFGSETPQDEYLLAQLAQLNEACERLRQQIEEELQRGVSFCGETG